ncbi:MAG: CDP-diacylglycerol--glycerol-3-phosphate 3-phosphatidyltransferase [Gammaproteobacteria bacterium 39-13]|nr:CDP-diacylglycerol--glycerol-3-phosphate 3-phosphatidyltransferase [Gammaproteobacteria bacterium]OJV94889.1 MAG: CDP-diacylglycerol--glycerol-3-phosphate 3-phosphatidyltransferase [Gammaproteobacteria bacterium 39-13]
MSGQIASIPNAFTAARIILIPCFVVAFYLPTPHAGMITASIFCLAGITDWLDGYLARRLNQTSRFGAFLDPVADKLIVAVALVLLVGRYGSVWVTIPAAIIVSREIAISALREWMAEIGKRTKVSVSYIGKLKTFIQIIAIILLLSQPADWQLIWVKIGIVMMYLAAFLTLWSMVSYLRAAWSALTEAS